MLQPSTACTAVALPKELRERACENRCDFLLGKHSIIDQTDSRLPILDYGYMD
jgi:hypothetical protein